MCVCVYSGVSMFRTSLVKGEKMLFNLQFRALKLWTREERRDNHINITQMLPVFSDQRNVFDSGSIISSKNKNEIKIVCDVFDNGKWLSVCHRGNRPSLSKTITKLITEKKHFIKLYTNLPEINEVINSLMNKEMSNTQQLKLLNCESSAAFLWLMWIWCEYFCVFYKNQWATW